MARRDQGTGGVYFGHARGSACTDEKYHRRCSGRWVGALSLGRDGSGRRNRRTVTGRTKTDVLGKLRDLREELGLGIQPKADYTVKDAAGDWFASALTGRSPKTVSTQRELLRPITDEIGNVKLRELTARQVRAALVKSAASRSNRTVRDSRAALVRVITYAQANELVARNVAALVRPPEGQKQGRPSRALTLAQTLAVLEAAAADRLHAYFVMSILTGVRTEEARALRWDHVVAYADGEHGWYPVADVGWDHSRFAIYVWRSVRSHGDVKTPKSRRTVALPAAVVAALRAHWKAQARERARAGELWRDHGLVFASEIGTPLDSANVRRSFRRVCMAAGIGKRWSPREMRHTFVSIMSDNDVPIEKIADLIGHTGGSRVTETVYRQVLRPVVTTGAEIMDEVLSASRPRRLVRRRGDGSPGSLPR